MPLHLLELKVGAPIILLRNLDPANGLCNGTRLLLTAIQPRVLRAKIVFGDHAGKEVLIPRIALDIAHQSLPFKLRRLQFPVRLAFSLTINKAQGQSLDVVGLDLTRPVFTHGQLYVGFSRATDASKISVLLDSTQEGRRGLVKNVVYRQIVA
ncbi:hypothetical protein FFLO_02843 [Filobasidium floriforme]|uniref:DNA helicase Pif1-like 2B domain-containing protein n=1 Tax=Filobasidium floriforme TaxID=5210 RepID=A0A8K0JS90_9TREE|nr:hypothetical protein FFLO_02843 [Filobasidium floriforme]